MTDELETLRAIVRDLAASDPIEGTGCQVCGGGYDRDDETRSVVVHINDCAFWRARAYVASERRGG